MFRTSEILLLCDDIWMKKTLLAKKWNNSILNLHQYFNLQVWVIGKIQGCIWAGNLYPIGHPISNYDTVCIKKYEHSMVWKFFLTTNLGTVTLMKAVTHIQTHIQSTGDVNSPVNSRSLHFNINYLSFDCNSDST